MESNRLSLRRRFQQKNLVKREALGGGNVYP